MIFRIKPDMLAVAAASTMLFLSAACTDNDYMVTDKGSEPLELTVSTPSVVLEEKAHASEALRLSWTTGTNNNTGARISYTLQIAKAGTDFADPIVIKDAETQVYSWQPGVEQLNSILIDEMHATPGTAMDLEARVTAYVAGFDDMSQTSECSFTATPYEPVTETLYLIGDATPNGWSADNATEMARVDNGVFTWTGQLKAGEFKFITTAGEFLPSYNNNGHGGLVYRDDDAQPDEKFRVETDHVYKVDVNLLNLSVTLTETEGVGVPYDNIFFVGDVTGWNFLLMNQDPLDPFLFRTGVFFESESEFKFGTASGSWENMYKAAEANAPFTSTGVEFIKGFDPDNKWKITVSEAGKAYKVCLDIRPGQERMLMRPFTPYTELYLVGDAAPGGWDLGQGTPMTVDPSDPNVFTWTGHLNTGELKFSADLKSDWNGAWFMAATENATPTGTVEKTIFIDKGDSSLAAQYKDIAIGDVDRKWVIGEAGTYTITINQLLEEISIVKN